MVFSGFVTACLLAKSPTIRSPFFVIATTEGVVRLPSTFSIIFGAPTSIIATAEFVVPKSIPIIFDIYFLFIKLIIFIYITIIYETNIFSKFFATAKCLSKDSIYYKIWVCQPGSRALRYAKHASKRCIAKSHYQVKKTMKKQSFSNKILKILAEKPAIPIDLIKNVKDPQMGYALTRCIKNTVWISPYPYEHLFTNIKKDLGLGTELMIIFTDKLDEETKSAFLKSVKK